MNSFAIFILAIVHFGCVLSKPAVPVAITVKPDEDQSATMKMDNLRLFLELLRQHQRDVDQTYDSFERVIKRDDDWIIRDDDNYAIKTNECRKAAEGARREFAIFVGNHPNDFEQCVDQLVESYLKDVPNANLKALSDQTYKCVSITRIQSFWQLYTDLRKNAEFVCKNSVKNKN